MSEEKNDYAFYSEALHSSYLFYTMEVDRLNKQLQTAKEENERLKSQNKLFKGTIKKFNLDWYGEELDKLTQQNKQMREALKQITNLDVQENDFVDLYYSASDIAQQALKGSGVNET